MKSRDKKLLWETEGIETVTFRKAEVHAVESHRKENVEDRFGKQNGTERTGLPAQFCDSGSKKARKSPKT